MTAIPVPSQLPTYNVDAHCPKCDCSRIKTTWDKTVLTLTRTCSRCHFEWHESALDGGPMTS